MSAGGPLDGKKLEIVKQAFDRFYDGGFHATGIDAVMADSGISKRTLYKYFPAKEDLIEAVLDHYGTYIVHELFDPVTVVSDDPRQQILAFFDIRKAMIDKSPTRGCLGIKASLEYAGKHPGIAAQGKTIVSYVDMIFSDLCDRAGLPTAANLGKKINILFQGALLLAQVCGDSAPLVSAKEAVSDLLDMADVAGGGSVRARRSNGA